MTQGEVKEGEVSNPATQERLQEFQHTWIFSLQSQLNPIGCTNGYKVRYSFKNHPTSRTNVTDVRLLGLLQTIVEGMKEDRTWQYGIKPPPSWNAPYESLLSAKKKHINLSGKYIRNERCLAKAFSPNGFVRMSACWLLDSVYWITISR